MMQIQGLKRYQVITEIKKIVNPTTGRKSTFRAIQHGWTWEQFSGAERTAFRTDRQGRGLWLWNDSEGEWRQILSRLAFQLPQNRYFAQQKIINHMERRSA